MGHQRQRLLELHPARLVEFGIVVVGGAADWSHEEEVDRLVETHRPADEEIADLAQRSVDLHRDPRLLTRLADGGLLQRLAGVRRPLGQGPQRRAAPVDEDDLDAAVDDAVDDAAGGGGARGAERAHAAR